MTEKRDTYDVCVEWRSDAVMTVTSALSDINVRISLSHIPMITWLCMHLRTMYMHIMYMYVCGMHG